MPNLNRHIIQKQVFELTFRESKGTTFIQQQLSTLCAEKIMPLLDELFSRLVDDSEVIQIDALEIDLGSISPDELERILPEKIVSAVEQKLEHLASENNQEVYRRPLNFSQFDAWLKYLEKGSLPWQAERLEEATLQTAVLESLSSNTASLQQFRALLLGNRIALDRLVKQYDEDFLHLIMQACFGRQPSPYQMIRQSLQDLLMGLPASSLIHLFSRKTINARTIFTTFWRQTLLCALQNNKIPINNLLIAKVLEMLNQREQMTPALVEIIQAIQYQKKPLNFLKDVFYKMRIGKSAKRQKDSKDSAKQKKHTDKPSLKVEGKEINEAFKESPPSSLPEKEKQKFPDAATSIEKKNTEDQSFRTEEKEIEDTLKESNLSSFSEEEKIQFSDANDAIRQNETKEEEDLLNTGEKAGTNQKEEQSIGEKQLASWTEYDEGTQYYVQNAGLVLIHPFLSTYFKALNLLKEGQFVDEKTQERAIHLLHFLSTGETRPAEYDLILSKLLCNLPFNFPIDRQVELSHAEREEGDQLLQAVINHWGALGKVKPDSLREGFLIREGKLEKRPSGWFLIVEKKTIDILLDQLPWGIGMVTLPWMEEILKVEWI